MTAKRLKQEVVKAALAKAGITVPKATQKALQDVMLTKVREELFSYPKKCE